MFYGNSTTGSVDPDYLSPLSLGEILDATIKLYKKQFYHLALVHGPFTGFYLAYLFIIIFLLGGDSMFGYIGHPFPDAILFSLSQIWGWGRWVVYFMSGCEMLFIYPLTTCTHCTLISDFLQDRPISLRRAYASAFHVWIPAAINTILLTILLGILLIIGLFGGVLIVTASGIDVYYPVEIIATLLIFCFSSLPVFFIWVKFSLLYTVVINEGLFLQAFKRSWELVKGQTIRVFFSLFLFFILFPGTLVSMTFLEGLYGNLFTLIFIISALLAQALLVPLLDTARTVIYFQMRACKEGFNLKQRIEQLEG